MKPVQTIWQRVRQRLVWFLFGKPEIDGTNVRMRRVLSK